ncbi:MAG: adenine phosphoribosyltransferase [Pseudomonadota bacterium]
MFSCATELRKLIRTIPDFPNPGAQFKDITTLLSHPTGLRRSVDLLFRPFLTADIDVVAGIEARGFILGGAVAHELGCGFVPLRKEGKLPAETLGQSYELGHGSDGIEIHTDAIRNGQRILVVDDLLATGGTAEAAIKLLEQAGGTVIAASFVIDLIELGGRQRLEDMSVNVHSLISYSGD